MKPRHLWIAALCASWTWAGCALERQPEPRLAAHLWKRADPPVELTSGDSVRAGDELYLDVVLRRASYVYVLNEDARRVRQIIYPCRGWDRSQPLAARRHLRLPPPLLGREVFWPLQEASAREHLLVLASARPVLLLDGAVLAARQAPLCAAALNSAADRWLDDLSFSSPSSRGSGTRPRAWEDQASGQTGWILDFDLAGAMDHA